MPETPFTGLTAKITLGTTLPVTLGYMSGFDLTLEKDIIEIIAFGAQYKEKVPSIKDWSASVDGTFAMTSASSQEALYTAFESGDPITVSTYLDDDTFFSGSALVTSLKISSAPDDKSSITCDLAGTGAVTRTVDATP